MSDHTCSRCHKGAPEVEFGPSSYNRNGLKSACRVCLAEDGRARYVKRREWILESNRRWAEANPDKVHGYKRAWDAKNPERGRRDHARDPARANARKARWAAANPDNTAERARRRRALKLAATVVPITVADIAAKVAYWGGLCWMCGGPYTEIDHVKPLSRGGAHMLANLRPACRACNLRKRDAWPYPYSSRGAASAATETLRETG